MRAARVATERGTPAAPGRVVPHAQHTSACIRARPHLGLRALHRVRRSYARSPDGLHPTSHIPHPTSYILPPTSYILHPRSYARSPDGRGPFVATYAPTPAAAFAGEGSAGLGALQSIYHEGAAFFGVDERGRSTGSAPVVADVVLNLTAADLAGMLANSSDEQYAHSHSHSHSHSHTRTHTHILTLTLSHSHTLTLTLSHSHTLTPSRSSILALSLPH